MRRSDTTPIKCDSVSNPVLAFLKKRKSKHRKLICESSMDDHELYRCLDDTNQPTPGWMFYELEKALLKIPGKCPIYAEILTKTFSSTSSKNVMLKCLYVIKNTASKVPDMAAALEPLVPRLKFMQESFAARARTSMDHDDRILSNNCGIAIKALENPDFSVQEKLQNRITGFGNSMAHQSLPQAPSNILDDVLDITSDALKSISKQIGELNQLNKNEIIVKLPYDWIQGSMVIFTTPTGQKFEVEPPPGLRPGNDFIVELPETSIWKEHLQKYQEDTDTAKMFLDKSVILKRGSEDQPEDVSIKQPEDLL